MYLKKIKSFFLITITLLLIININNRNVANAFGVVEILALAKETAMVVYHSLKITNAISDVDIPFINDQEKQILAKFSDLSRKIDVFEKESLTTAQITLNSLTANIKNIEIYDKLNQFVDLKNKITAEETTMKLYTNNIEHLENITIINFAEWNISPNSLSIQSLVERIHLLMVGTPPYTSHWNTGLLVLLSNHLKQETTEHVCDTQQSAQQVVYQLYNAISITEIKAYSMMQFSWMILKMYGRGNFTKELELMRQRFNERIEGTQSILKSVLDRSDRFVYRCDPTVHKEGETYEQLTKLLQGYVENEVDMNNDDTCKETCSHYQYTESFGCYKDLFCAKQSRCRGKLLNCEFVKSDMHICQSSPSSSRRYEYIEYSSGRVLGQKSTCSRGTTPVDSWWRWIFWHCSYCFCICDDSMNSDRYFNLRSIISNTTDNRVVTGLRFRKHNRVIHLQIQEGQLGSRGNINATTLSWKALENYRITDRGIKNGIDYHTMTWNNRSIDLDDLFAKLGHVVTGVRFRIVGTHVNLEMRITEFDFVSGMLLEPETTSEWISNDNTDASSLRRTPIKLYKPDVPIKKRYSKIDSKSNQYIEFNHSDMDADAAQTTVPFLDAQDVISIPPVPLGGIGLYHKGNSNYGGFVAPKIITYNYAPHIMNPSESDEFPSSENNIL